MELATDLIEKAKTAKTAEELLALAKAEGVELSAEEAKKAYADLHKSGELSDDELDSVAGGCDDSSSGGTDDSAKNNKDSRASASRVVSGGRN